MPGRGFQWMIRNWNGASVLVNYWSWSQESPKSHQKRRRRDQIVGRSLPVTQSVLLPYVLHILRLTQAVRKDEANDQDGVESQHGQNFLKLFAIVQKVVEPSDRQRIFHRRGQEQDELGHAIEHNSTGGQGEQTRERIPQQLHFKSGNAIFWTIWRLRCVYKQCLPSLSNTRIRSKLNYTTFYDSRYLILDLQTSIKWPPGSILIKKQNNDEGNLIN